MRGAAARAAAVLLVLALAAPGCDLVDSLTPFGIGTQDYDSGNLSVNGIWAGTTGSGGAVEFQVGSDTVIDFTLNHVADGCTLPFEALSIAAPVVSNVFIIELALDQGRFTATGRFTADTTCSGTYRFESLPAGVCPSSGTGTFTAQRTSL